MGCMMLTAEMLSEPTIIPDIYASGLSHVENLGDGTYRLTFFAKQESIYGGEEYVVVCRLIGTTSSILGGIKTLMRALGTSCCGAKTVARLLH